MKDLDYLLQFMIGRPVITSTELATYGLFMFFIILSILEACFPENKSSQRTRSQSYQTNISLFLTNSALLSLMSASTLYVLADQYSYGGLLDSISNPAWKALAAFLTLDLVLYLWHRACHRFDALWMFHRVHHSDLLMNVSTAFRVHFLESILTIALKAVYVVALGVDKKVVLTEEAIMTLFVMLHHTNISFQAESLMSRIFIVPYLHRVHHSVQRNEHDQNYGAVFSIWDRLFGTLAELKPVAIGIKNNPPQDFVSQLKLGFTPVLLPAAAPLNPNVNVQAMVAEAAYYKALKRGFLPGYDLIDWLEAEKEILKLIRLEKPGITKLEKSLSFDCSQAALAC